MLDTHTERERATDRRPNRQTHRHEQADIYIQMHTYDTDRQETPRHPDRFYRQRPRKASCQALNGAPSECTPAEFYINSVIRARSRQRQTTAANAV